MKRLRRYVFGINPQDVLFGQRGFLQSDSQVQKRLEFVGSCFVAGYHAALEESCLEALTTRLLSIEPDFRGFAFEGAGMSLALQDILFPWQKRLPTFLNGQAYAHRYLVLVGAGWVLGRIPIKPRALRSSFDSAFPLLSWLTLDGYGFHNAYFQTNKTVVQKRVPRNVRGYERAVFDQGIGRCLWFVSCADVESVVQTIQSFPRERQADLWSGVGLACTYAGGVGMDAVARLAELSGKYRPQLAQGAAFAAKARYSGGNPSARLECTVPLLCGISALEAAEVTDRALIDLGVGNESRPAYALWRQRIQSAFGGKE